MSWQSWQWVARVGVAGIVAAVGVVMPGNDEAQAKSDFTAKPFMGWSSWSVQSSSRPTYGTRWLTEGNLRNAADALASKLKAAGYEYLNIDAGWNATFDWNFHTDVNGIPNPDAGRFPSGLQSLIDYVHGKGLKIGLYGAAGLEKEVYDRDVPILGTNCTAKQIAVQPLTPPTSGAPTGRSTTTIPARRGTSTRSRRGLPNGASTSSRSMASRSTTFPTSVPGRTRSTSRAAACGSPPARGQSTAQPGLV